MRGLCDYNRFQRCLLACPDQSVIQKISGLQVRRPEVQNQGPSIRSKYSPSSIFKAMQSNLITTDIKSGVFCFGLSGRLVDLGHDIRRRQTSCSDSSGNDTETGIYCKLA